MEEVPSSLQGLANLLPTIEIERNMLKRTANDSTCNSSKTCMLAFTLEISGGSERFRQLL